MLKTEVLVWLMETELRFNESRLLLYQDLNQSRLDKIERPLVNATALVA